MEKEKTQVFILAVWATASPSELTHVNAKAFSNLAIAGGVSIQ